MLNGTSTVLSIGIVYLFSFLLGYALFLWAKPKGLKALPFFVKFPIYLALGLLDLAVLVFIIGIIGISEYVFLAIALLSMLLILYQHYPRHSNSKFQTEKWAPLKSLDNFLPAVLFIFVFLFFSTVIVIFGWPPPGDVFNHGLFTSTLVYNQKVVFTLTPLSPSVQLAPFLTINSLHALSAALSILTGLFPGEAVFILGGAIAILLPLLLYSLTYILTKSKLLSFFVFLSTFLIGPGLERWAFGYFYNGPYPNLFGFLAVLLFTIHPIASSEIRGEIKQSRSEIVLATMITLGMLFVYPVFVIFPVLYFLVSILYERRTTEALKILSGRKTLFSFLFLLVVIIGFAAVATTAGQEFLGSIGLRVTQVYGRLGYAVYVPIFYTSAIGVAVLFAGVVSIFFAVRRFCAKLALFYLIVFVPVMLSLQKDLYAFFSILLPNRSLILCSLLSWVLISILLNHFFSSYKQVLVQPNFKNRSFMKRLDYRKGVTVSLIAFLVLTPSLASNLALEPAYNYSWLNRAGFANDYDVLLWIHNNVQPSELIMNDYSYTSRYLLSFSIKNVTAKFNFNSDSERNRAMEVQDFWRNPTNISRFLRLVEDYEISYILVTSERGYGNWVGIGGDNRYTSKPFTPAEYKTIFNDNPCLELMFEKGNAGVYKVSKLPEVFSMYALEFDGIDDYVRVEHNESLSPLTAVTIAVWIKPIGLPSKDTFLLSKSRANAGYELGWRWNGRFALYINNTIALQGNKVFNLSDLERWWHIVTVYDGSNASIYINGEIDANKNYAGSIAPNTAPLGIGCRQPTNPYGFVPALLCDDLFIFNRALSPNEVAQLHEGDNVTNGLVLQLDLETGEGLIAYDQSHHGNNGTIYGAIWTTYNTLLVDSSILRT